MDTSNEVILEAREVTKHFGGLAAVEGVNMTLHRGEISGLIGPNGAGKTTFVNVVTSMLPITRGQVIYKGQDITAWPPHRIARIGIARTFQIVKPFRNMTVQANVAVGAMYGAGGQRRNTRQALERAEEVLEFVGLADEMHKQADQLTLAGLKRLELAKALALDPEVLFLDEVMAGLNPKEMESAMDLVRQINQKGVTILIIEHVMKAIVGVCQRVVVLHYGQKLTEGTPQEVLSDAKVIAAYLGEKFAQRQQERWSHAG
ncbi:MAG TPA: ABC transporter ATP-binding protein [Anaerolineae bacterium]|nr:ABC transporter ATP-binding protein [Anaerolineae bacterium]HIQ04299.1 ABC transporter ATP-binding protein [Anaerolineae bacterium]